MAKNILIVLLLYGCCNIAAVDELFQIEGEGEPVHSPPSTTPGFQVDMEPMQHVQPVDSTEEEEEEEKEEEEEASTADSEPSDANESNEETEETEDESEEQTPEPTEIDLYEPDRSPIATETLGEMVLTLKGFGPHYHSNHLFWSGNTHHHLRLKLNSEQKIAGCMMEYVLGVRSGSLTESQIDLQEAMIDLAACCVAIQAINVEKCVKDLSPAYSSIYTFRKELNETIVAPKGEPVDEKSTSTTVSANAGAVKDTRGNILSPASIEVHATIFKIVGAAIRGRLRKYQVNRSYQPYYHACENTVCNSKEVLRLMWIDGPGLDPIHEGRFDPGAGGGRGVAGAARDEV